MENQVIKAKSKIFKAVHAAVSFQNFSFSPRGENRADMIAHRLRTHQSKAFSGPIGPMIPSEARRRPNSFENQEPTSPKVSCMGHIKHKKACLPKETKPGKGGPAGPGPVTKKDKKKGFGFKKIFGAGGKTGGSTGRDEAPVLGAGPGMMQMRKFASSRDTFANFDWTAAQIALAEDREYYSDGERGYSDGDGDVIDPFSAPVLVARAGLDLEPRMEINLWKRRSTAAQLKPLQLNMDKDIRGKI
ncbi:syringolide-induced protein 14-1-1 [Striga asiatica]|uniref:Syringolide-induced protein 14-1-1 n=1 Tax=Striga asiatica TaxID=4170 RepID=A0A5A7PMZ5_STRAF|nr:syringolide-induced protein 14-1-1 [Striga asiatica]